MVLMGRDMTGRKDKRGAAKFIRRCIPPGMPNSLLHPVAIVHAFFGIVQAETRRLCSVMPPAVWRLPGEGSRACTTADMGKWLTQAAGRTPVVLPAGIPSRCHRSGSGNMA